MAKTNAHIVVQENGVLIPKELFGRNEQVLAELKETGVLAEPSNGSQPQSGDRKLKPVRRVPPIDLSRELLWLKEHKHEYTGQWVALDGDRLISHGTNAREVSEAARAAGVEIPFLTRIEPDDELPFGGW